MIDSDRHVKIPKTDFYKYTTYNPEMSNSIVEERKQKLAMLSIKM